MVYDDDHYYMGGVVAELLPREGFDVEIVTPAAHVSAWTVNTMEVGKVQRRLLLAGVTLRTSAALTAVGAGKVTVASTYTGQLAEAAADSVVMVTARLPDEELYLELLARQQAGRDRLGPRHRRRLGPGHHRRRRLVRPPLRGGIRRGAAQQRRCALPARGHPAPRGPGPHGAMTTTTVKEAS